MEGGWKVEMGVTLTHNTHSFLGMWVAVGEGGRVEGGEMGVTLSFFHMQGAVGKRASG